MPQSLVTSGGGFGGAGFFTEIGDEMVTKSGSAMSRKTGVGLMAMKATMKARGGRFAGKRQTGDVKSPLARRGSEWRGGLAAGKGRGKMWGWKSRRAAQTPPCATLRVEKKQN
jgi:hypothetical protein